MVQELEVDETVVKNILDNLIENIENDSLNQTADSDDNIEILKVKLKTLENKYRLLNDENFNLNKLFDDYKQDREVKYEQAIKFLNEKLNEKEHEIQNYEVKLNEVEQHKRQLVDQLNADFKLKLDQTFKKFQESQKDKTSIVMKYAEAEKKCIELNRSNEHLQTKLQDYLKEKQRLIEKFEAKNQERAKFNSDLESKLAEITNLNKQIEKLKETNVLNDIKLNNLETKYKNECEINGENKKLIESLNNQLVKLKSGQTCNDAAVATSNNESNNDVGSNSSKIDDEQKNSKLSRDYNSKLKLLNDEVNQLKTKLISCENENKANIITMHNYKDSLNTQKQTNKELFTEVLKLRESQAVLSKEQQEKQELKLKVDSLTTELNDLNQEMQIFKQKQTENLSFTSKLTEKNTKLQSENSILNEKLQNLNNELENIKSLKNKSDEANKLMTSSLNEKLSERIKENEVLVKKVDETTKLADELSLKLNDLQDECSSLKKKHAANIKDLTNQLQKLHKQIETNSKFKQQTNNITNTVINESSSTVRFNNVSRSNSINSLDKEDLKSINGSISSSDSLSHHQNNNGHSNDHNTHVIVNNNNTMASNHADVYVVDIDKQKIIDKVVKLQKTLAKKTEKIDFLQDHVTQLTADLQKKTRIIQAYAMKEDVGAFTSEAHDANKREMSRKTGVMASIYGNSNPHYNSLAALNGSHMTMELCLEINSKLQALLEDTLIKNITLKESLETLGQEIARLSQENRQIKIQLSK